MEGSRGIGNENSENELEGIGMGVFFPADEYGQFDLYLEIARPR
jgi:hypothetical protein